MRIPRRAVWLASCAAWGSRQGAYSKEAPPVSLILFELPKCPNTAGFGVAFYSGGALWHATLRIVPVVRSLPARQHKALRDPRAAARDHPYIAGRSTGASSQGPSDSEVATAAGGCGRPCAGPPGPVCRPRVTLPLCGGGGTCSLLPACHAGNGAACLPAYLP